MPDSETTVVFKILKVLARQSDANHALSLDQIAGATHMRGSQALRYLALLKRWGVVRADAHMAQGIGYRLTRYGQHRAKLRRPTDHPLQAIQAQDTGRRKGEASGGAPQRIVGQSDNLVGGLAKLPNCHPRTLKLKVRAAVASMPWA